MVMTGVFLIGVLVGWRTPVFIENYQHFRTRATHGRAIIVALAVALHLPLFTL